MRPFAYARPRTVEEVLGLISPTARPKGGGNDLLDLAKRDVSTPAVMVDLAGLGPASVGMKTIEAGVYEIEARATLSALAESADVRRELPALADAALEAATPQIRNRATLAGNLLQRPRCAYFRDPAFDCLKRGGKSCPSLAGEHREGAILGNGTCCATHPSNLAVALTALGGTLHLAGPQGKRADVGVEDLWIRPEEDPLREARVDPGQLVVGLSVVGSRASAYVEIDAKQSFDWAAASCAVSLRIAGGKVESARVVLGAVAPVPWRSKAAEEALVGKAPDERAAAAAAEAALAGATPLRDNGHKVTLAKVAVRRAVLRAASRGRK